VSALFWDAEYSGKYWNNVSEGYTASIFEVEKAFSDTYPEDGECSSKHLWTYIRPQGVTYQKTLVSS
jgi:hypothetical protein